MHLNLQIIICEGVTHSSKLEFAASLPLIMESGASAGEESVVHYEDVIFSNEAVDDSNNGSVYEPMENSCGMDNIYSLTLKTHF